MIISEINTYFSHTAVYFFLLIAVVLIAIFRILHFFIPVLPLKTKTQLRIRKTIPVIEFTAWLVFLIWGINYFIRFNIYFATGLGLILLLIMFWFAWYALRDMIAGIIIKSNRNLKINDSVHAAGYHGKIIRFGFRNLVLETENGKNIYLPYTMLIKQELIRSHPSDKTLSHSFEVSTSKDKSIEQTIEDIRLILLSLPWISQLKSPFIRFENENDNSYVFNVTAYSIEKHYFILIEKAVKESFKA
ncbi:MAG: mechanosensitive ion channel [Bacteroidales bacterium]|nr:mechanosensitive ion channel [Bacteroidales bacterium]